MPALLLVGGMGTRLRSVISSTPKPLAAVGGRSFLQLLVRQLRSHGVRRVVMCTGHMAEQIEQEFGDGSAWKIRIEYSQEDSPAGTGGAVKLAEAHVADASDFLVLNGDSFLELDFERLVALHRETGALVTMAARRAEDASRYGTLQVDNSGRVVAFDEKTAGHVPGLVNGGVYVFSRKALPFLSPGPSSLERDLFPRLLPHGVYALEQRGLFIDIGTPEDYARAQQLCDQLYAAALQRQEPGACKDNHGC